MRRYPLLYLLLLALVVASPTLVALAYHHITRDPTFRPLALTAEAVWRAEEMHAPEAGLQVQLLLREPGGTRREQIVRAIRESFRARGIEASIRVIEAGSGQPEQVSYHVGRNRIGPFPLAQAAQGVKAASEAFRLARN